MSIDWGAGLEIIRPWLLLAFNGSLLGLVFKFYVDNRRMRLAEKSRGEDYQLQVSADGRNNLQMIIDNLVRDITAQREQTDSQAAAHARCEDELRGVRQENRMQGNRLDGLCRQFIAFSESVGRAIPPGNWSAPITAMMAQLEALATAARDEAAN